MENICHDIVCTDVLDQSTHLNSCSVEIGPRLLSEAKGTQYDKLACFLDLSSIIPACNTRQDGFADSMKLNSRCSSQSMLRARLLWESSVFSSLEDHAFALHVIPPDRGL